MAAHPIAVPFLSTPGRRARAATVHSRSPMDAATARGLIKGGVIPVLGADGEPGDIALRSKLQGTEIVMRIVPAVLDFRQPD